MALTTYADLKIALGIAPSDTSQDATLTAWAAAADAAVTTYCLGPGLSFESQERSEFYTGNRGINLVLRRRPVTAVANVWVSPQFTFDADALLVPDVDYRVDWQEANLSRTGLVTLLSFPANLLAFWPVAWGMNPAWGGTTSYGLTGGGAQRVGWPAQANAIKVQYTAGYASIPADLTAAATQVGCWLYNYAGLGGMVASSQSYIDTSVGIQSAVDALAGGNVPALGSARSILQRYRETTIGSGP